VRRWRTRSPQAHEIQATIGFPCVIRPSFTMGGSGGGIAYNREEFEQIVERGLDASPTSEVLIEESVIGWKEFEMEVRSRSQRQLHHRLLHREPRSHGRAHR
jgi:carbamoylphosphate synthase large subunit